MKFNFTQHTLNVFQTMNTNYDEVRNLLFDLCAGNQIYDAESDRIIPKAEAEDKLRKITQCLFGVNEKSTKREMKRAIRDHYREYFDILEEAIDVSVETGFRENEFFNSYVDMRNIALGDEQRFVVEDDKQILTISKAGTSHHDYALQRLNAKTEYAVATQRYGVAVGYDLNMYLIGREDITKLVNTISRSFVYMIQQEIYAKMLTAANAIPTQARSKFVGTGLIGSTATNPTVKEAIDEIIENVSIANGGCDVVIMGTKTGLKNFNKLTDVNWISVSQKEDVANTGRIGTYEGNTMIELPQRFAFNDVTATKLIDNTKFWIMPVGMTDKFIKFVDCGETEINEISEKGEAYGRRDDIGKYEVQRDFGTAVQLGRYFGMWNNVTG